MSDLPLVDWQEKSPSAPRNLSGNLEVTTFLLERLCHAKQVNCNARMLASQPWGNEACQINRTKRCILDDWLEYYCWGKGQGIYLESRYPWDDTCSSDFTSPGSGSTAACIYWSNLGSVHQVPNMAGWTQAVWQCDWGNVCPTLLHMASTGNRTSDLLILSPMPYPLGDMLT